MKLPVLNVRMQILSLGESCVAEQHENISILLAPNVVLLLLFVWGFFMYRVNHLQRKIFLQAVCQKTQPCNSGVYMRLLCIKECKVLKKYSSPPSFLLVKPVSDFRNRRAQQRQRANFHGIAQMMWADFKKM